MERPLIDEWIASQNPEKVGARRWKDVDIRGKNEAKGKTPMSAFTTTVTGDVVETLRRVHARRSPQARAADAGFNAPITTDEERWRKNPNRLDFPGVDTIPVEKAAVRVAPVVVRLKERGHLHKFSYERKKDIYYGAFNARGFGTKKKEVLYVSQVTGKPRYHFKNIRSGKPEIEIYKPKYSFLTQTPIQRTHTVAHESGHAIDWGKTPAREYGGSVGFENVFSGSLKKVYKKEMVGLTEHVRGAYTDKDYRECSNELIADAMASLIIQPRATRRELHKHPKGQLFYLELETSVGEVLGPGWRKAKIPRRKDKRRTGDPLKDILGALEF